jgi:hypothetical protein
VRGWIYEKIRFSCTKIGSGVIKIDLSKNPSSIHAAGRLQSESRGFVTFIYSDASAPAPGLGSRSKRSKSQSECQKKFAGYPEPWFADLQSRLRASFPNCRVAMATFF